MASAAFLANPSQQGLRNTTIKAAQRRLGCPVAHWWRRADSCFLELVCYELVYYFAGAFCFLRSARCRGAETSSWCRPRATRMADTQAEAPRGAVAQRKPVQPLSGSGQHNAAAGARPHDEQEKCPSRAATTTPLLQRAASRLATYDFAAADDVCTPSPNVTVRARRKRRRRKASRLLHLARRLIR